VAGRGGARFGFRPDDGFEDSNDDDHPSAGGKKIPANGKRRQAQQGGRGLKRGKATREEVLIENVGAQRLELEKKLEYSKERDAKERDIMMRKEEHRHEEAMQREERECQRENTLDREFELRLREFEFRMNRMEKPEGAE
jgi:hypothetical protein